MLIGDEHDEKKQFSHTVREELELVLDPLPAR
jgi:hypothetical protein